MKVAKDCPKLPPPPKPNLKNKDFVRWSRPELVRKEDNIISTEWHERLRKTAPFNPVYDNAPLNMVYLLSGEYGRIWQKERDEWYSQVFVLKNKEKEMDDRRKKIRKQIKEGKKAAEISLKERKERRAKELEIKAKAEAENLEKLRAKIKKLTAKKEKKTPVTKKEKRQGKLEKSQQTTQKESSEPSQEICPKGWTPVELTLQCECSDHKNEQNEKDTAEGKKIEIKEENCEVKTDSEMGPPCKPELDSAPICSKYYQKLEKIQKEKNQEEPKDTKLDDKPCFGCQHEVTNEQEEANN